jgi:hypothetical protein
MLGGAWVTDTWQALLDAWPYSPRELFAVGLTVTLELTMLVFSIFFLTLERFRWCQHWRVHSNPRVSSPPPALVREALMDHLLNGVVLRPVFAWVAYPAFEWCGMQVGAAALPSFTTAVAQLAVCALVDDTWFYFGHRLLHTKWLYARVHKKHHRFRFTHPLASDFAHPAEDVLVNTLGTMLGPLLLGTHMSVVWLYAYIKLSQVRLADGRSWVAFLFCLVA